MTNDEIHGGMKGWISLQMVAEHWNRLPKEQPPSLTELKKHLDNTLRHMV